MRCPQCQADLSENVRFCNKCGKPLTAGSPRDTVQRAPASSPTTVVPPDLGKRKTLRTTAVASIIAAVVCGLAVGLWFYRNKRLRPEPPSLSGPVVEVPPAIVFRGESEAGTSNQATAPSPQQISKAQQDVAHNSKDPKTLNDSGTILSAAGDPTGIQLLQQAHQIAPDEPTITYNLARAQYQQGNTDQAVQLAQAAVQQKPQFDEAHLLLATTAVKKQDYDTADQQLKQVEKQVQECALLIQGAIKLSKHQPKQALASFQQALQLASNDPNASYDTRLGYQQNGDLANAQQNYQTAINQNPQFAEAHNNLGAVLLQKGDAQGAFNEFHQASLLGPETGSFSKNLGQTVSKSAQAEDNIVGNWVCRDASLQGSGTQNGKYSTISEPLQCTNYQDSYTHQASYTKMGRGAYRRESGVWSTAVSLQPDGSYLGMTVLPAQFVRLFPGDSVSGSETIWIRGNTLFSDFRITIVGPHESAHATITLKQSRTK